MARNIHRKRAALLLSCMGLLILGTVALKLSSRLHQSDLNRRLVIALMHHDHKAAIQLVNAGADPNTPYQLRPPPSLLQVWNKLLHRPAPPERASLMDLDVHTAFQVACGVPWDGQDYDDSAEYDGKVRDNPRLVEAMLRHGARIDTKDHFGRTPLYWTLDSPYYETFCVLLASGADVNAQNNEGDTPLQEAVRASRVTNDTFTIEIIPELLARGADPNLRNHAGVSALRKAQFQKRGDLVKLFEQAEKKK